MFRSLFIIITAVMTLSLGFHNGDSVLCSTAQAENCIQLSDDEINCLDNECFGYGQGHQCDEKNRPLCALDFNSKYSCYDAYAVFESDKNICLTFDQGYENGYTAPILDTLKEKNAKAIFFLTGDYARRNPELVKRMIDEGHIIANHGYDHASLPSLSIAEAEKELMCNHDYVKETYGVEMTYFRPPCGEYSEKALAVAQKFGYKTLVWSFAYCDWDVNNQPDVQTAFNKITGSAHGGEIVLLHSVSSTNAAILGDVIDSFRAQGYEIALPS